MTNDRYRNWCFTAYSNPTIPDCKYCIYQTEICPTTNKEHYQGYIEFKDKYSMKKIKELFNDNTLHLEVRKGSQKQAIAYCSKSESRKEGTKPIVIGKPLGQGHRTDLDEIFEDIEEGCTAKEILIRHKGNAVRHISCIKKSLMIYHELDEVDRYILQKRGEESLFEMDQIKCIVEDKHKEAIYNNPSFENFDGQ